MIALKIFDADGNGFVSDGIRALEYAVSRQASVANCSWSSATRSQALQDAIHAAWNSGTLVVAAAGNSNSETPRYPAALDRVVAVAATTPADSRASFSNYGSHIDLSAPGENILSTAPGNGYQTFAGTSMATPHVAGLAALLKAREPRLNPAGLTALLQGQADDLGEPGWDRFFGHGRVNARKALEAVEQNRPPSAEISFPADRTVARGIVLIRVNASDDRQVERVDLWIDFQKRVTLLAPPWEFPWDTKNEPDGIHSLQAVAFDEWGLNEASASVLVTVDNTPPPSPRQIHPHLDVVLNRTIEFDWSDVQDLTGVTYQIQVDAMYGTYSPPELDVAGLKESGYRTADLGRGAYWWRVRAIDGAGNIGAWCLSTPFEYQPVFPD